MIEPLALADAHFNPRAPRGARQFDYIANLMSGEISIHVPREGHDEAERYIVLRSMEFQSTCPARGTTSS